MKEHIEKITEILFKDIPYDRTSEEAKLKIDSALEQEYIRLTNEGKSDLQAIGGVMLAYGNMDSACKLAQAEKDDLFSPREHISKRSFKMDFLKLRVIADATAFVICVCIFYFIKELIRKSLLSLIYPAVALILGSILLIVFRKLSQRYSYSRISLHPAARELYFSYSDRYTKRLINSIFIFLCLSVYMLSLTMQRMIVSGMNRSELLVLLDRSIFIPLVGIFLCIKNGMCGYFLISGKNSIIKSKSKKYILAIAGSTVLYLVLSVIFTYQMRYYVDDPFPILYISTGLFIGAALLINYHMRQRIVRKNLFINKSRIAAFTACALMFVSIQYMKMDNWMLFPYISNFSRVEHQEHDIKYDHYTGVYTVQTNESDFKILHLTDIHLGGSVFSSNKDTMALNACYRLIEYTNPDLVIVTGDLAFPVSMMSMSLNNKIPVAEFATFMKNVGIPWAFTFGNHDTEAFASSSRDEICNIYRGYSQSLGGILLYPGTQPDITGRNNQLIKIENPDGSIRQALFLIDSNDYTDTGLKEYDRIHDDQVRWYEKQIHALSDQYGKTVPSMLFFHIPLREYLTAYRLYEQGSDEVTYHFGEVAEDICCSALESDLFDTALRLGSTKAMFCGHDHYNNISLEYKGIRLTYGMSIDYLAMPGIDKDTAQRGGELIILHEDSSFDIIQIPLTKIDDSAHFSNEEQP